MKRLLQNLIVITAILLLCTPLQLVALWGNSLTGQIELTGVNSEIDSLQSSNLRQQYTVSFQRPLTPIVTLRSSFRYYKFDLAQLQGDDLWQEEWQPTGELSWSPDWFTMNANLRRRESRSSSLATSLRTDSYEMSAKTRSISWPVLTLRSSHTRIRERGPDATRRSDETRLQGGLDYYIGNHSFNEGYTSIFTDNLHSGWESRRDVNTFRWGYRNSWLEDNRLRLSSGYTHSYRYQLDQLADAGTVLNSIPFLSALYAEDSAPEFGELDQTSQLGDGNITDPVDPEIDIGSGAIDRNIGIDFGFERPVSALYIYLDRVSGLLDWRIYTSDDNLNWSLLEEPVEVVLNLGYNRFELTFPTLSTRYIKAVNGGLNEVTTVFVTEIEALLASQTDHRTTDHQQMHFLDLSLTYQHRENLSTTLSSSYQREPVQGLDVDRRNFFTSLSGHYLQSELLSHTLKIQQVLQDFAGDSTDLRDIISSYSLRYTPLTTLSAAFSAGNRMSYYGNHLDQEYNNALLVLKGTPSTDVECSWESGISSQTQHTIQLTSDTWTHRFMISSDLTGVLNAALALRQQSSRIRSTGERHLRRQLQMDFSYQVTRTILFRSGSSFSFDESLSLNQDLLLSWNATNKLRLGAQAYFTGYDDALRTSRYSSSLSYRLGRRSMLHCSYGLYDYTEAGGSRTANLQAGIRTRF